MRYVEVNGVRLSSIGLGCWQFGSREWGYGKDYVENEAGGIVRRALELGITLIDTAEVYGFGTSERVVGQALADHRSEAFVATKILPVMPLAPIVVQRGRASARRLQTQKIDLYQIHWPNPVVPIGPQMAGMRRLQQEGVIEHVGVSNFSLRQWQGAERGRRRHRPQRRRRRAAHRGVRPLPPQAGHRVHPRPRSRQGAPVATATRAPSLSRRGRSPRHATRRRRRAETGRRSPRTVA